MKKEQVVIVILSLIFSGLVYEQQPGVNLLIFTLAFTGALAVLNPFIIREPEWWFYAVLLNLCGFSVFMVTSGLSVLATMVSLVVLVGRTAAPHVSLPLTGVISALSVIRSPLDIVQNFTKSENSEDKHKGRILLAVLIAILASLPFLLLFRVANPLFDRLIRNVDVLTIDGGWILFTLLSFGFIYGLIKTKLPKVLDDLEKRNLMDAVPAETVGSGTQSLTVIGVTFFGIINLMLIVINILVFNQVYIQQQLPEGLTLSQFVHESVAAIVASIVLAVTFILFLFKGELNFTGSGKIIRLLVFIWIIQSAAIILNCSIRNIWYIEEFQLTISRIVVFVFLGLSLIILFLSWQKIIRYKSAWWFVARTAKMVYIVLTISTVFHWSRIVTAYNIRYSYQLDVGYLLKHGDANLPQLVMLYRQGGFSHEEAEIFKRKIARIEKDINESQWPGFSIRQLQNRMAIEEYRSHSRLQ